VGFELVTLVVAQAVVNPTTIRLRLRLPCNSSWTTKY